MYRYSLIIFLSLFLLQGCFVEQPNVIKKRIKPYKYENKYALFALMYEQEGKYKKAIEYFEKLYNHTEKKEYLREIVSLCAQAKDMKNLKKYLDIALKKFPNDSMFLRSKIRYYLTKKDSKTVKKLTLELIKKYKTVKNYEFAGSVFLSLKNYKLSLKYFERAYGIGYDEKILTAIADILYLYLNRKDDAIAYLETHVRMKGCSKKVCYKLIDIYAKEKDIDGLISIYKRLYSYTKDEKVAKKAIELMMYKGDKKGALSYLKNVYKNNEMLLEIYLSMKDFKNALKIATKIYTETKNPEYLAKMAIYEFEGAKKKDKKLIGKVAKKFQEAIDEGVSDSLYLNYYGYLLIDYDMDIKKGIKLVKRALKQDPDSVYYIDSLAWGYYKLGRCKEAEELMKRVLEISKDKEVLMHYKKIKKCLKEKK